MTLLKLESFESLRLRNHYAGVVYETLQILWAYKAWIAWMVVAAVLLACIALALIGPRYTSEAIITLNFVREESASGAKVAPTATVDAAALVDRAARVMRSRATASAVVSRLGLDKDPDFAREPFQWRLLSMLRKMFFLTTETPPAYDLAVSELMQRIKVTYEPRSYLISVAVTTGHPEKSASLANAVALEYLRGQVLQQLADSQSSLERELAQLSLAYGERYPEYILGRTKLENLRQMRSEFRDKPFTTAGAQLAVGQTFIAAEKMMVPSGPNVLPVLGLAVGTALIAGIWLTLSLNSDRLRARGPEPAHLGVPDFNGHPTMTNGRMADAPIQPNTTIRRE
jgi:uncharacterized protein involved in exopolysaccharide biosynthesis